MKTNNTPLYNMLKQYRESNSLPFHMPGHILGRGLCDELELAGRLDITEIPGSDCLHAPTGVISEAQNLASQCFGSDYSLFMVNGSTSGLHTMIQAVVSPGGKLILGRDSHVSALNSLALIGAEPIFVAPEIDEKTQIPLGITVEGIKLAIENNINVQGILVTRPNYYGVACNLADITSLAKEYNIPVLVDEAHGAHFVFHEDFPNTAMVLGADICVQSLHKTLPALTQSAILHGRDCSVTCKRRVTRFASMLQTTSPSYLLMCSIDLARATMQNNGRDLYEKLKMNIIDFDRKISNLIYIKKVAFAGVKQDFTRLVLSFEDTSLTGFEAEAIMRERYNIVVEMADYKHIILIATPFHNTGDFDKLISALVELDKEYGRPSILDYSLPNWPATIPIRSISLREAIFAQDKEMPIYLSEGYISADYITPYPPGIPVITPGEIINADALEYIQCLLKYNHPVHGIQNGTVKVID